MSARPKVSVLVPTWNRVKLLPRMLESLAGQTFQDFEIVIFDDGSTDGTEEWAKKNAKGRIRYERSPKNQGVAPARNALLDLARADICVWQDSDDLSNKWRLELLLQAMERWEPPFVRSAFYVFKKHDPHEWKRPPQVWYSPRHAGGTAMFRRSKMGRYDPKLDCGGEDSIWEADAVIKHGTGIIVPFQLYVIGRGKFKRISHWKNWHHDPTMLRRVERCKARLAAEWERVMAVLTPRNINAKNRCERVPSSEFTVPFYSPEAVGRAFGMPPKWVHESWGSSKRWKGADAWTVWGKR